MYVGAPPINLRLLTFQKPESGRIDNKFVIIGKHSWFKQNNCNVSGFPASRRH